MSMLQHCCGNDTSSDYGCRFLDDDMYDTVTQENVYTYLGLQIKDELVVDFQLALGRL
jgi:hypothetical protein